MKRTIAWENVGRNRGRGLALAAALVLTVVLVAGGGGPAAAAELVPLTAVSCPGAGSEGWDLGIVNGWQGFGGTVITAVGTGGNPSGYLGAYRAVSAFVMSSVPPWAASYTAGGITMISVDVKATAGNGVTGPSIRVRRDSSSNGWNYVFENPIPNDGQWRSYKVWFDPTWTNGEAEAAGWHLVAGGTEWTFAETMSSVGYLIIGVWDIATGDYVGFDNAKLSCPIFADGFELGTTSLWSGSALSP